MGLDLIDWRNIVEANLIDLNHYAVKTTLKTLLQDKTTKKNIIWATTSYADKGPEYQDTKQIQIGLLTGLNPIDLQPRVLKSLEEQQSRTKSKAEVFTPGFIINNMNNYLDEDWFGYKDVFNKENDKTWITNEEPIQFGNKKWQDYIKSTRLEITCGEAPYLVSRYDASTGKLIEPPTHRIGLLDRKLRVINENVNNREEWFKWVEWAYKSIYGYEFQGDSLLIGRINLLMTFVDNVEFKWNEQPTNKELKSIANIIAWNLFQMDGLTDTVPLGVPQPDYEELTIFDLLGESDEKERQIAPKCKIKDWRSNKSVIFEDLKRGK